MGKARITTGFFTALASAFHGLLKVFRTERNMIIHIFVASIVLITGFVLAINNTK